MDKQNTNKLRQLQRKMFFEQRDAAIKLEQENFCYKQYQPPQIVELKRNV